MKKLLLLVLAVSQLLFHTSPLYAEEKISEVEFNETPLIDVIRVLSEMSSSNIIATPEATKKIITIHLKNTSVLNAVKSIARISDLWYRFDDDTNTYRIMTREEYGKDLIVRESEHIEVFRLLNANVQIVAQAIEDLFGQRVILSLGIEPGQQQTTGGRGSSSRGSVSNRRSLGGGRNQTTYTGSQVTSDNLSLNQVEQIAELLSVNQGQMDNQALQEITSQAQPIYVTVNNEHNMILVRTDDMKVIDSITKLVKEMDLAVPQVMLEMKILDVLLGEEFNSIFNFEIQPSGSNQSNQPALLGNNALFNTGTFVYEFLNDRLRANIEFLEANRRLRVLSNPMVLASNHREAELFIGEENVLARGFNFNPATRDALGNIISPAYVETLTELQEIGITLRLTPRINADRTVELLLEQESSTINPGGGSIPVINDEGDAVNVSIDTVDTARLTGTIMAKDGLTVAVGGLIRTSKNDEERKVPLLSEIPVIGRIFRSDIEAEQQSETVLLITPRIINSPEQSENIRQTDNAFYRDHNQQYPEIPEFPNRFIDKSEDKSIIEPELTPAQKRQRLYQQMSEYAATIIRTPEIQRPEDALYNPVDVLPLVAGLFDDPRIKTVPEASWNRGGLYVTAVALFNRSSENVTVDYQNINGKWLAASVENTQLAPIGTEQATTYLYLVSALPFNEVVTSLR
jgi:type II secretory pathway component GspD/PulD (secretin)